MNKADVIIIGAGLMGAATVLNLAQTGKKVLMLEKEVSGIHASAVNAGGVRRLNRAFEEIPITVAAGERGEDYEIMSASDMARISGGIAYAGTPQESLESRVERLEKWMNSFKSK